MTTATAELPTRVTSPTPALLPCRAARPSVSTAAPALATVAIHAAMSDDGPTGGAAFAIACADFSAAVVAAEARSEIHALIDAFEYVICHPHFADQPIEILVSHHGFAAAIAALLAAWPHVTVTTVAPDGYLMHRSRKMTEKVLRPVEQPRRVVEPAPQTLPRLTCATDGSAGYLRHPVAAYGWITEEGGHGSGTIGGRAARVAELAAVTELIQAMDPRRPLTVLIDCREVLDLVIALQRSVRAGTNTANTAEGVRTESWHRRYVTRLLALLEGRDIIFEKVAAHCGHPLNETADRLAVYSRRAEQMSVPFEVSAPVVDRIVAEGLWAWSEAQAAAATA